jgi:hypothetical protein
MPRLKKTEIYIEPNFEDRLYLYVRHGIVALFVRKGSQVSYIQDIDLRKVKLLSLEVAKVPFSVENLMNIRDFVLGENFDTFRPNTWYKHKVREQIIKVNKTGATFLSVSKFSRVERGGSVKNISLDSYNWLNRWSTDQPDWIRDCIQKIEEF